MKKLLQWMMAAIFVCGASVFTSCSDDKDSDIENLSEKIIGMWLQADINGNPALTNEKSVTTFVSATKAYFSISRSDFSKTEIRWNSHQEYDVKIDGNKIVLTTKMDEHVTLLDVYTVSSITNTELIGKRKHVTTRDGVEIVNTEYATRLVKIADDYRAAVVGTWQGRCTSEGSVFDDGQEHRWQYNADGTYVYYVKDGDNWVPYEGNTLNEYFVDGNLLCTRWIDLGQENREWWEINIDGDKMNWTALRQKEDGSTFTATFEMKKVQ